MQETQSPPQRVPMEVIAQYIKDVSFENPHILSALQTPPTDPQITVNVNVEADKVNENIYEVTLTVDVKTTLKDGQALFLVDLKYAGLFNFPNLSEETLKPFLLIECPRLLFPFARNIISDLTRDGCMPPLMLNPMDFEELYRNKFLQEKPVVNA
jgi:preprotein translocase subunit SecB